MCFRVIFSYYFGGGLCFRRLSSSLAFFVLCCTLCQLRGSMMGTDLHVPKRLILLASVLLGQVGFHLRQQVA